MKTTSTKDLTDEAIRLRTLALTVHSTVDRVKHTVDAANIDAELRARAEAIRIAKTITTPLYVQQAGRSKLKPATGLPRAVVYHLKAAIGLEAQLKLAQAEGHKHLLTLHYARTGIAVGCWVTDAAGHKCMVVAINCEVNDHMTDYTAQHDVRRWFGITGLSTAVISTCVAVLTTTPIGYTDD